MSIVLVFLLAAVAAVLWRLSKVLLQRRRVHPAALPSTWPHIDVVVPFHNEEEFLPGKVQNLRHLDYPRNLIEFWLVDGASTDRSMNIVEEWAATDARVHVISCSRAGKLLQLKEAFARCRAGITLVTDADSLIHRSAVRLMADAMRDPKCGGVSTTVVPKSPLQIERLYWNVLNRLRLFESLTGCASSMMAPAYMVRRSLVISLPDDVVADDLFFSFKALSEGHYLRCLPLVTLERRTPKSFSQFLRHKFRKGHAYATELIRFAPAATRMAPAGRLVFASRVLQFVCPPAAVGCALALSVMVAPALLVPVALMAVCAPLAKRRLPAPIRFATLGLWLGVLQAAALLAYPLFRQSSNYSRVG